MSRSRPARPCSLYAAAAVAAAVALPATAQVIYAGNLASDYRLPGGIEPVLHLRTYDFESTSLTGSKSAAWALGGWAGLRSPWLADFFQAGVVFYTSQKLWGPADEDGTKLLRPGQLPINTLGEAFGALRYAGQTFTGYRQLIDRPFVNPQDSRMVPNTFEAYTLSGTVGPATYIGGYITKMKARNADAFTWMSNVAGGAGEQQGLALAGLTWKLDGGGYVKLDEQYAPDVFNTFYVEGKLPFALGERTRLTLGGQYYPQRSVGGAEIGSFSTWGAGVKAALAHGPATGTLYYTQTGRGYETQNPWGDHASFLNLLQIAFNTAGERAFGAGADFDFAEFGAPGLTASAIYAQSHDRINSSTGAPQPNRNETDVSVWYAFAKGSLLEGLSATFRYGWQQQDGSAYTATQMRAIVNYAVRF